jgi:hypothetical protein
METSIDGLSDGDALQRIGSLIDASADLKSASGTDTAFLLLDEFQARKLDLRLVALSHYYRANAWANRDHQIADRDQWAWEQPEVQEQILALRTALSCEGFSQLHETQQCQILTNLGGRLSFIGRSAEALEIWNRVLQMNRHFAMALGNVGICLSHYGKTLYDKNHAILMQVFASEFLAQSTSDQAFYESDAYTAARNYFSSLNGEIQAHINIDMARRSIDLDGHSLGETDEERAYRSWCLHEKLFLNPLNDVRPMNIAAHDVLTLPSLTVQIGTAGLPPSTIGFFNQMKQEFVSARYFYYESMTMSGVHFSDRGVLLYNTMDLPSYSLSVERMRAAFRIAYSLMDKIAYFINSYFGIGRKPTQVTFKSIWYEAKGNTPPLLSRFVSHENLSLRALFWLSKDLFEDSFKKTMEPDAAALKEVRDHLEHKYFRVHEILVPTEPAFQDAPGTNHHVPSHGLSRMDFSARTLRVLKLTRAALIYLSLAVHREERLRLERADVDTNKIVWPNELEVLDDERKQ